TRSASLPCAKISTVSPLRKRYSLLPRISIMPVPPSSLFSADYITVFRRLQDGKEKLPKDFFARTSPRAAERTDASAPASTSGCIAKRSAAPCEISWNKSCGVRECDRFAAPPTDDLALPLCALRR